MQVVQLKSAPSGVRARRALVVDDDPFMIEFLRDMLGDLGIAGVTAAKNGTEAATALEKLALQPDVVLCDLQMPGTDGFQFMETLAQRQFKGGVILVSGMDPRTINSATLMARFHRLNFLGTLGKPVSESALREALARLA